MSLGFKARGLQKLTSMGLTVLPHRPISTVKPHEWVQWITKYPKWGVRTDAIENTGELLPFFHYSKDNADKTLQTMLELNQTRGDLSFIWSTALDHLDQVCNAVVWCDASDVLYGEISLAKITLRQAWILGKDLSFVEIDGGNADWFRNRPENLPIVPYLRKVRKDLLGRGKMYEVTIFPYEIYYWEEHDIPSI